MKKTIGIFFVLILIGSGLAAQDAGDNLSPQRKQAIDSLALEKVRDLSKDISINGDKKPNGQRLSGSSNGPWNSSCPTARSASLPFPAPMYPISRYANISIA